MAYQSLRFGKYRRGVLALLPAIGRLSKKVALGEAADVNELAKKLLAYVPGKQDTMF